MPQCHRCRKSQKSDTVSALGPLSALLDRVGFSVPPGTPRYHTFVMLWFTVVYCASLCFTVLCCALLCFAVLYCALLCFAVLYCALLCFAVLCCALLCFTVLYCASVFHCVSPCFVVLDCALLCFTVLYCALLCLAVVYFALLCFTVLCCALLCFVVFHRALLCLTVLYNALLCFTVLHSGLLCFTGSTDSADRLDSPLFESHFLIPSSPPRYYTFVILPQFCFYSFDPPSITLFATAYLEMFPLVACWIIIGHSLQGIFKNLLITNCLSHSIQISSRASPSFEDCMIQHGQQTGIFVCDNGAGLTMTLTSTDGISHTFAR